MKKSYFKQFLLVVFLVTVSHEGVIAQIPDGSPRMNPFVRVVQQSQDAVVPIYVSRGSGSAAIFHPDGYALTNSHVVTKNSGLAVSDGKRIPFKVVGRLPEKDLAVIHILGESHRPWPFIPLGTSHDILNGETVAVLGNPGGRGTVVTSGVVSVKDMFFLPVSALVMTYYPGSRRDRYIQYDAATNFGNSGGPLINMDGKLIGIVAALLKQEQNSGFAIPANRIRDRLADIIDPEFTHERWVGCKLDPMAQGIKVVSVESGSPAEKSNVLPGDELISVNGKTLQNPEDWLIVLDQLLPTTEELSVRLQRDGAKVTTTIQPTKLVPYQSIADQEFKPGVNFEFYEDEFAQLPKFENIKVVRSSHSKVIDLDSVRDSRKSNYAVVFHGFVKLDQGGLFRFTVTSDDGTRLAIHDSALIEHDGVHPPMAASNLVRLTAGFHPIRLEYFQKSGESHLSLKLEQLKNTADLEGKPVELRLYRKGADAEGE